MLQQCLVLRHNTAVRAVGFQRQQHRDRLLCGMLFPAHEQRSGVRRGFPVHPVERIARHVFPDTCGKAGVRQQAVPDGLIPELLAQQPWQNHSSLRHTLRQNQ